MCIVINRKAWTWLSHELDCTFWPNLPIRRNCLNLWMAKEVTSHVNIVLKPQNVPGTRCTLSGLVAIFLLNRVMYSLITIESKHPVEYLLITSHWQEEEEKERNNKPRKVGRTKLTPNFYGSSSMKYI